MTFLRYYKVWWPYATLFEYFIFLLHYIHSYNHSLITFAEALLHEILCRRLTTARLYTATF
jgi:hypothetical protein